MRIGNADKEKIMSERIPECNDHNLDSKELEVRVEYGGFAGIARMVRLGQEALKWQIAIFAESGREICNFDGPDIVGSGPVLVTCDDIENAQHEINQAIQQFIWDPMSQA